MSSQYSMGAVSSGGGGGGRPSRGTRSMGHERLYEAYNELHTLAQVFEKPFDAPAILVVGHQTDGKSALIEALMGFQFNHVGGGTKTRRPITLHMKYNQACTEPTCFMVADDGSETEMSLEKLQGYIEVENARLEAEQLFWGKEIVVRMEYKYCPNLTIIDTPGLISAAPGERNGTLQNFSKQVEIIVRAKMEQKEFTILCLEDTNDWNNATTRRLVMQVDPHLVRTVVVSTKFDTRIPQFARGADVEMFLRPAGLEPTMMDGAPFFTSVPSGRVGDGPDFVFRSNDDFRGAVADRETADVAEIEAKMGRKLEMHERSHMGVGQLRRFLEALLQKRYLESVPSILPMLDKEMRTAQEKLSSVQSELDGLNVGKLKAKGRVFVESFLTRMLTVMRGSAIASPEDFGETLVDEQAKGGSFVGPGGKNLELAEELPNAAMRLFGGAQFHRAMAEFRAAVGSIQCPDISREEIANACGLEDFHDGVNYMRVACVIAVTKAQSLFEPFVHQLGFRLSHILRRLLPITMHLLEKDNRSLSEGHGAFVQKIGTIFHDFLGQIEKSCKARCLEDLKSVTRYVTWSLHTKNQNDLQSMLAKVRMPKSSSRMIGMTGGVAQSISSHQIEDCANPTVDLLQSTLWNRQLTATSEEVVAALMCQVFEGIRDYIVQATELKFNTFFLMELIDAFPCELRAAVEEAYEKCLDTIFDVAMVRTTCESRLRSLESEIAQVDRLRNKFSSIQALISSLPTETPSGPSICQSASLDGGSIVAVESYAEQQQPSVTGSPAADKPRSVDKVPLAEKLMQKSQSPSVAPPSSAALKFKGGMQPRVGALVPPSDSVAKQQGGESLDPALANPGGVFGSPLKSVKQNTPANTKAAFLNIGNSSPRALPLAAAVSSSATK